MNEMLWLSWRHHGNTALSGNATVTVATALGLKVTPYRTSLLKSALVPITLSGPTAEEGLSYRTSCPETGTGKGVQLGPSVNEWAPGMRPELPEGKRNKD